MVKTAVDQQAGMDASAKVGMVAVVMLCINVLGQICLAGDFFGVAAVLGLLSKSLSLTDSQAGLAQGAFGITYCLSLFFWSPASRKLSIRQLFMIGLIGSGILMFVQSFATSFAELFVLRLAIGVFDAAVWVGSMKLVMEWFPRRRQGLAMAITLAAYSLAITLDFAVGLPYATGHGWQAFFVGLGIITVLVGILSGLVLRTGPYIDPHSVVEKIDKVFRRVFQARWVWVAILGIFGDLFVISAMATWMIPNYIKVQGMSPAMAPTIGTIMGLSQIVFLVIGGYLSDRLTNVRMLIVGSILSLLVALLCTATTIWALPVTALVVVAALCGVGVLSGGAIFSMAGQRYGALGPAAAGYAEIGGTLSTFVAPALMGALLTATASFTMAFTSFVIVEAIVLGLLLILLLSPKARTTAA